MSDGITPASNATTAPAPQLPEAPLLRMEAALASIPENEPLPGGAAMRRFFAQLISDHRDHCDRSPRDPRVALDREFWLRIHALCEPFLEAQTKWKNAPDDVSRGCLENALMAFWTGFGQLPAEIVSRTLSKEALATWRVIDDEAHGIQRDPAVEEVRERYFVVPRLPARSRWRARGRRPTEPRCPFFRRNC